MAKRKVAKPQSKPRVSRSAQDALTLDVKDDMVRIDNFMSSVLASPESWETFRRDPNGAFVKGLVHPPTSKAVNDRANAVFWATLANSELCERILSHYEGFEADEAESKAYHSNLSRGSTESLDSLDTRAADHLLRNETVLREVLQISLDDLNRRGLLQKSYTAQELGEYLDSYVTAIQQRKPISQLPVLEKWDDNYGIGMEFGFAVAEVGPVATAAAAAEVAIAFTVLVAITSSPSLDDLFSRAFAGKDVAAANSLMTLARLIGFSSELALHVRRFIK